MNRFVVKPDEASRRLFEQRWATRESKLAGQPGFVGFSLLRRASPSAAGQAGTHRTPLGHPSDTPRTPDDRGPAPLMYTSAPLLCTTQRSRQTRAPPDSAALASSAVLGTLETHSLGGRLHLCDRHPMGARGGVGGVAGGRRQECARRFARERPHSGLGECGGPAPPPSSRESCMSLIHQQVCGAERAAEGRNAKTATAVGATRCPSGWRQPRRRSFGMCPSSSSAARVSPTSARHGARPRRRRRRRRRPGWRRCVRRGRGRWRSGWRGGRRSPHGRRRSVTWLGRLRVRALARSQSVD